MVTYLPALRRAVRYIKRFRQLGIMPLGKMLVSFWGQCLWFLGTQMAENPKRMIPTNRLEQPFPVQA